MKYILTAALWLQGTLVVCAQGPSVTDDPVGVFSAGSRNTVSLFNEDGAMGKGIGAQFRLRLGRKLNSEWYLDYITSRNGSLTFRNDYHIGWSLQFYFAGNSPDNWLLQPYLVAGHCFDKAVIGEQQNRTNRAGRLSMATQAGLGMHINITPRFDCSLSGQYMLHFGKDIREDVKEEEVLIRKEDFTRADGHLLFTISFNYKLFHLWHGRSR